MKKKKIMKTLYTLFKNRDEVGAALIERFNDENTSVVFDPARQLEDFSKNIGKLQELIIKVKKIPSGQLPILEQQIKKSTSPYAASDEMERVLFGAYKHKLYSIGDPSDLKEIIEVLLDEADCGLAYCRRGASYQLSVEKINKKHIKYLNNIEISFRPITKKERLQILKKHKNVDYSDILGY